MISYQPAFDPFHAIFRVARLGSIIERCRAPEADKVRILDFYMCFPFRAVDIKFQRGDGRFKKVARSYDNLRPYGGLPDDADLIARMMPAQRLALETLAFRGSLDPDALRQGRVVLGDVPLPAELLSRVSATNDDQTDLMELLETLCLDYPLLGVQGLKQRTGLLEHRYDAI